MGDLVGINEEMNEDADNADDNGPENCREEIIDMEVNAAEVLSYPGSQEQQAGINYDAEQSQREDRQGKRYQADRRLQEGVE